MSPRPKPKIDGAGWPEWAPRVCSRCGQRVTLRQARVLSYSVILGTGKALHLDPVDCPAMVAVKVKPLQPITREAVEAAAEDAAMANLARGIRPN